MNAALVCPNDQSAFLFCRGILEELKDLKDVQNVYVICDIFGQNTNGYYARQVESWGVKHIPLEMDRFVSPWKDLRYCYRLYKILRRDKIDLVVNIATKINIYGAIAARLAGADKVLCSVWGRGRVFMNHDGVKSRLLRSCLLKMYRLAFSLSTKVWFTNKNDFDYFIGQGMISESKTILTKNYVNTDDYRPMTLSDEKLSRLKRELDLEDGDKVVIMVGRMIWAKGVREYVEAARLLKDDLPGVKFILVGPEEIGSLDTVPHDYLERNKRSENFRWMGFRTDLQDLYALSALAVLPSYYKEGGYPRALTEPMAMGKPVIAADTVDCRSPVEHGRNGFLVPIKDPRALADAIAVLMRDDLKRAEFGAYSRMKALAEYDEKVIIKQLIRGFCPEKTGAK